MRTPAAGAIIATCGRTHPNDGRHDQPRERTIAGTVQGPDETPVQFVGYMQLIAQLPFAGGAKLRSVIERAGERRGSAPGG
jgi:hypothetical protein